MPRPRKPVTLTPPEIRAALAHIGWSARELGARIGAGADYAARLVNGKRGWPPELTPWLLALADAHRRATAPTWRESRAANPAPPPETRGSTPP